MTFVSVFHLSLLMKRKPKYMWSHLRKCSLRIHQIFTNLWEACLGAHLTRSLTTLSRTTGRRRARLECRWPWCLSGQFSWLSWAWRCPSVSGSSTATRARNLHSLSAHRCDRVCFDLHVVYLLIPSFRTGHTWRLTAALNTLGVMIGNSILPLFYQVFENYILPNRSAFFVTKKF